MQKKGTKAMIWGKIVCFNVSFSLRPSAGKEFIRLPLCIFMQNKDEHDNVEDASAAGNAARSKQAPSLYANERVLIYMDA